MGILISILCGLAVNAGYDLIKSRLPFQFSGHSIQKAIQEAYKRALQQWTVNRGIRNREEIYLQHHLDEAITQLSENPFAKGSGNDLLALFRAELEKDDRTQGFLHYCLSQDTNKVAHQILQIVHPQETHRSSYANDFFIQEIAPAECYILRTVRLISRPQQTTDDVLPEGECALIDLIARHPRLVILGSAGMGKSTELKQLALRLTDNYCPCHFPLNTFTAARSLEQMLHPQWLNADQPKVLLLDGLDEVLPEDTERVKREIGRLANTYREIPIIVSCRSNFYTLPVDGVGGSLSGFTAATLEPLTAKAVQTYIFQTYPAIDSEEFLFQVHRRGLTVLLENPFWVIAMIEFYQEHKNLGGNITELLEYLIERNFERDAGHYDGSIPLKEQRYELFRSLETVACCMNVVGTRTIPDAEASALLSDREAYRLIRCSGTLAKNDVSDRFKDTWQFKHGYFQEFLTARLLSRQTFDQILVLIRSASDTVLPGWQNTLTLMLNMLPSRSELFQQLVDWFSAHDPAALIAMEPEKLNNDLRTRIFKSIFNYYKEKDIWLDDKKVIQTDYARFGRNDDCIRFLIDEASDSTNSRRIQLNALVTLLYFDYSSTRLGHLIVDRLMVLLHNPDHPDGDYVNLVIGVIGTTGLYRSQDIDTLFERFQHREHRHIRSALYHLALRSGTQEVRIDYFLHGLTKASQSSPERSKTVLLGETSYIYEAIENCRTAAALRRIFAFMLRYPHQLDCHDSDFRKTLPLLIQHAAEAYAIDNTLYFFVKHIFQKTAWWNSLDKWSPDILPFFDLSRTHDRLLLEMIERATEHWKYTQILAKVLRENDCETILDAYKNNLLGHDQLDSICHTLYQSKPQLYESLKDLLEADTDYRFTLLRVPDYKTICRQQTQEEFNILFDRNAFQEACMEIFGVRESLTKEEYEGIYQEIIYSQLSTSEKFFNNSATRWMSEMLDHHILTPLFIQNWCSDPNNENYFIHNICNLLQSQSEDLEISDLQLDYLHRWFDRITPDIDPRKIFVSNSNDYVAFEQHIQSWIILLTRFEFSISDELLLDLTLCCLGSNISNWPISLEYIVQHLNNKQLLPARIVYNLRIGAIDRVPIYESHSDYIFKHRLTEGYDLMVTDLVQKRFRFGHWGTLLVRQFFEYQLSSYLIPHWDKLYLQLQLVVAEQLGRHNWLCPLITDCLPQLYEDCSLEEQRIIYSALIRVGDIRGLEFSIRWAKQYMRSPFSQNGCNPAYFENLDALPALMILLELSYDPQIATDHELDRMLPLVMAGLQHLALAKRDNYGPVTETIHRFMAEHSSLPDILFLNTYLEQMKQEFGVKYAPTYSWHEARQLISQQKLS